MKYQCANCETIFEHEKYLTECDGEKTCPICDTMEVVYRLSNRFEQQVRQGVSSADETTGNSAEIRKVLLRLLNIANKQREYHLVNKLKNKKQETSLQKVEYGDNKAAESAYEFIIKEIMDEVSLTY